jgi:hypothetical protein
MTEAPPKPESIEELRVKFQTVVEQSEAEDNSAQRQALRGTIVFWSVMMVILYCTYVQFSSTMMSNGKSQFQRVAQSIGGGS